MPSVLSGKRFYSFGVLSRDEFYCSFHERADGDSFVRFLRKVHRRFGKVLMFTDNAACHKSARVRAAVGKFGGDIVIRHFPAYTPQLNPTEGQWRNMRLHTANRLYGSAEAMKASIRRMLRSGEIKTAKMSGYLT